MREIEVVGGGRGGMGWKVIFLNVYATKFYLSHTFKTIKLNRPLIVSYHHSLLQYLAYNNINIL